LNTAASLHRIGRSELWARGVAATLFAAAAVITWIESGAMSGSMRSGGMRMPGGWEMSMLWMPMPGERAAGAAGMFLLMWLPMMIAMMLPSSWPMLELYRKVAVSTGQKRPALGTAVVGIGYFTVWTAFGAILFGVGWAASVEAMRSRVFSYAVPLLAGGGLIFAGAYQMSPWKQACLRHCRSPLMFLGQMFRPGVGGAARVGLVHGLFCAGCCWALMLMQAILGVMNVGVMILAAALIGAEKLWTRGPLLARVTGVASILAGVYFLVHSLLPAGA
jgi:predicted metal-binding membrane protein